MNPSETLKVYAQGDREIVIERRFQAPRQLVWDCHTKPELVKRWMGGPRDWQMVVCEIDLRVGGKFRFINRDDSGRQMTLWGHYVEIQAPAKLVHELHFEPSWYPGKELGTAEFTEKDGVTYMKDTVRYDSPEALAMVLASPMASGLSECYAKMDGLLTEMGR